VLLSTFVLAISSHLSQVLAPTEIAYVPEENVLFFTGSIDDYNYKHPADPGSLVVCRISMSLRLPTVVGSNHINVKEFYLDSN
jgi:hypothetical protein